MLTLWKMALPEWRKMLLASFWAFLATASSIGLLMCSGYILSFAALHPSIAAISVPIVGVRAFGLARASFRWLDRMVSHDTALRLLERFRIWFYHRLEPLVPIGIRHLRHGDLFQALARDVDSLEFLYARVVAPPLVAFFVMVLMALILGMQSMHFVTLFLVFQALAMICAFATLLLLRKFAMQAREASAAMQSLLHDITRSEHQLRLAGTLSTWHHELKQLEITHNRSVASMNLVIHVGEAIIPFFSLCAVIGVTYFGANQVLMGELSGVWWVTLILGTWASFEAVQGFPAMAHAIQASGAAGQRLLEIAELPYPYVTQAKATHPSAKNSIQIHNLDFAWPDGEPILSNFSMALPLGTSTALIGDSGCGKTTLVNLLCGFLNPQSGTIDTLAEDDVAVLDQFPQLFTGSLAENLALAKPDASASEMEEVLRKMDLWTWALEHNARAPLDAWVGDQGAHLSGGQRQRLAAARVLLRKARLVVLDEPAAHLDPDSEERLLTRFFAEAKQQNFALLVITHRPQFLNRFDQIVEMHSNVGEAR